MDTPRHHAILLCNTAKNSVLIVVIPKTQVWIQKNTQKPYSEDGKKMQLVKWQAIIYKTLANAGAGFTTHI
jgi:hypothetical protein